MKEGRIYSFGVVLVCLAVFFAVVCFFAVGLNAQSAGGTAGVEGEAVAPPFRIVNILQNEDNPNIAAVRVFGVFEEEDILKVYTNDAFIGSKVVAAENVNPEGAGVLVPDISLSSLESGRNLIVARLVRDGVELRDSTPLLLYIKSPPSRPSVTATQDEGGGAFSIEVAGSFTEDDRVVVYVNDVEFRDRVVADAEVADGVVVFSDIEEDEFNNGENTVEALILRVASSDGTETVESERGATAEPVLVGVTEEAPETPAGEGEGEGADGAEQTTGDAEVAPVVPVAPSVPVDRDFECVEYTMVQKIFEELDEDYRGQMYLGQDVGIDGNTIVASGSDYRTRVYYKEGEVWEPSVVIVGREYTSTSSGMSSLTVSDGVLAIGTPDSRSGGVLSGSVHSYRKGLEGWVYQGTLAPSTLKSYSGFGRSVAMSDTLFAVAAQERDESGSVYVYTNVGGQWASPVYFTAADSIRNHKFGYSVSVDETMVAVGAPGDMSNGVVTGAVYVYVPSGNQWVVTKVVPDDGMSRGAFGERVLLKDGLLFVGAARAGAQGAVYVYAQEQEGDAWVLIQKLEPFAEDSARLFGSSFAYARGLLLVGAPSGGDGVYNTGVVFTYVREGNLFSVREKLIPEMTTEGDRFGADVSFDGTHFAVGAYRDDMGGHNAGAVYVYRADAVSCEMPEEESAADAESDSVRERKDELRRLITSANEVLGSLVRDLAGVGDEGEEEEEPESQRHTPVLSTQSSFTPDEIRNEAEARGLIGPGIPRTVIVTEEEESEEEETPDAGSGAVGSPTSPRRDASVAPEPTPTPTEPEPEPEDVVPVLKVGDIGSEVRRLQIFLNGNGYTVSPRGPGSPGNEDTNFSASMERALKSFQLVNGVTVTGMFDEETRNIILIYDPSF